MIPFRVTKITNVFYLESLELYSILLVPVLSKPCAIIMFSIQLIQYDVTQSGFIGMHKYVLDWILFSSCPHVLSHFASVLFCCMSWSFSGKRWLLTCMQQIRRLTHMQHAKRYSRASCCHAAHEVLLVCSARNIALMLYMTAYSRAAYFMSHVCFDWVTQQKLKNTCMFFTSKWSKCQLRCELYRSFIRVNLRMHMYIIMINM